MRWQKDKTANVTEMLSFASPNIAQIENRPRKSTLQVPYMLSSTLTPFPPLTLHSPSLLKKQSQNKRKVWVKWGEYRIQSEVKGEQHASEQAAEWTCGKAERFYKVRDNRESFSSAITSRICKLSVLDRNAASLHTQSEHRGT